MSSHAVKGGALTLTTTGIESAVTSYASSLRYMRHVLPLAVYNIVYHRVNLDEKLFTNKNIEDWHYKTFKGGAKHEIISYVVRNSNNILSLLSRKRLESFSLVIVTADDVELLESYKFTFKYDDSEGSSSSVNGKTLLMITKNFFSVISSLSTYTKHSTDNIRIYLQVEYTSLRHGAEARAEFDLFPAINYRKRFNPSEDVVIASVATGYHAFTCKAGANIFNLDKEDKITEYDTNSVEDNKALHKNDECLSLTLSDDDKLMDSGVEECKEEMRSQSTLTQTSNGGDNRLPKDQFVECQDVDCMCGIKMQIGISSTIRCTNCLGLFHTTCIGYHNAMNVPVPFVCPRCNDAKPVNAYKEKVHSLLRIIQAFCVANGYYPINLIRSRKMRKYISIPGMEIKADNTVVVEDAEKLNEHMKVQFYDSAE